MPYIGYRSEDVYGSGCRNLRDVVKHELEELGNEDIILTLMEQGFIDSKDNIDMFIIDMIDNGYKNCVWLCRSLDDLIDTYHDTYTPIDHVDKYIIEEPVILSDLDTDGQLVAYKERPIIIVLEKAKDEDE